ncbi:hypothetical protein CQA42_01770 [Helicobacter sp. MIT 99-5507]|nr:hypothetical protein CQA42_01770 [Helicobacter sp. MIT 99-5507]
MSLFGILISSCGYYPVSYYSKQSLGKNIYVNTIIALSDPENSIIAKDALLQAIATRLHSNLSSKENADTIITISMNEINMYSIADDEDGFPRFYRMQVGISFSYIDKNNNARNFSNIGIYDFSVEGQSTVTDEKRFMAINQASLQSIDKFVAKVASSWR